MSYSLFIDDIRLPKVQAPVGNWQITRNMYETLLVLSNLGFPEHISFDHDLGEKEDAMQIVKKMIEMDMDHDEKYSEWIIPHNFTFNVHSANPVGAKNITCLLKNYLNQR